MLKCHVFSNAEFNSLMRKNNWNLENIPKDIACISIGTPNYENKDLELYHWFSKNTDNVINLNFYDVTDYVSIDNEEIFGMTDEQANQLFKFIHKNIGKNFYIHCGAGLSRSQGIAKYIIDMYPELYSKESLRKDNPCEFPNLHVVCLLKHQYFNENFNNS